MFKMLKVFFLLSHNTSALSIVAIVLLSLKRSANDTWKCFYFSYRFTLSVILLIEKEKVSPTLTATTYMTDN